jgi:peptide/nickel transport system permease protein
MTGYLVRRVGQALIVIFGVSIFVFILIQLLPGGPRALLGPKATPLQVHEFIVQNGLNRPWWVQYWHYLGKLVRGNLGYSYHYNQSVNSLLATYLPRSALLIGVSTVLAFVVAVPLGIYQAVRRGSTMDYILTGASFVFYSMPVFWLGILLLSWFSVDLHIFPAEAPQSGGIVASITHGNAMILPVVTLAVGTVALFSRYMRSSALENLVQDYIRTARAKGVPERRVLLRHMLRNALIPLVTLLGLSLPFVFSGALITESVFNYPGMGLLFWQAAQVKDYAVLQGVILVVSVAAVVGSLLADVAYAALDPRIRYK